MTKHTLRAVHDQDLDELLVSLGLQELLDRGELRCRVCGRRITKEDVACVYPDGNQVAVCCSNRDCYEKLLERSLRDSR